MGSLMAVIDNLRRDFNQRWPQRKTDRTRISETMQARYWRLEFICRAMTYLSCTFVSGSRFDQRHYMSCEDASMNLNPYETPLGVEEPTQESSSRQPDLSGALADSTFMHAAVCVVAS